MMKQKIKQDQIDFLCEYDFNLIKDKINTKD